ncbi:MAG: NAD(P)-binding protein [Acidimicrobiales bacterium]
MDTDYLVVGAGAMGMAFADTILNETEGTTITIVDRHARPGGHWNDAYPFVRLHQPSAFYGVNSRKLGDDRIDETGWNAGLYELASGAEVLTYYDHLMHRDFLPSGRVTYLPMSEYEPATGDVVSLTTGERTTPSATTLVDATYMKVSVPSQRPPAYAVADGAHCAPLNDLPKIARPANGYVVIGAGKTGADACLWLLKHGVDPDDIRWVMPRDSWYIDRKTIQPGEFFEDTAKRFIAQFRHIAESESIPDLFRRLEADGILIRLTTDVEPTMYRCSTVTTAEVEQLRRITNVIRLGRVQRIDATEITLDEGSVPTTLDTVHIDCTADGLERRAVAPVFDSNRITLQTVRHCQQVFSAAFIAHCEAAYDTEDAKNHLCGVVPHPDSATDWIRTSYGNSLNGARWNADPELQAWLSASRLDGFSSTDAPSDELMVVMMGALENAEPALAKLEQYVAELDAAGA